MKIIYRNIISIFICCLFFTGSRAAEKVGNIADFMKYQRDGNDATPVVTEALNYCRQVNATKLIFPKGAYNFRRDFATEKYVFMSNNDEGLKRFVFDLTDMSNLVIDGQGSTFMLTGF